MNDVWDWLLSEEARGLLATGLVAGLAERLADRVPIERMATGLRTLHPEIAVVSIVWTPEGGATAEDLPHSAVESALRTSPITALREQRRDFMRVKLDVPAPFPLLESFREGGSTDYLLMRLPALSRDQMFSVTTRQPGGFTDAQVELLLGLRMPLSLRLELSMTRHVTRSLLRAYLGGRPTQRVLHGDHRRQNGERMEAVVFTCDLRGFTSRVDHRPSEEVLEDLDRYFECVADPWVERGGDVLKFIGDAVLGILPLDRPDAADVALEAAQAAFVRLAEANASLPADRPPLEMGYVLHAGPVVFGNIGSRQRIDFTVIGPVVNEASRIEKLTKELAPLLLTDTFVGHLADPSATREVGRETLRGVTREVVLYTA